MGVVARDELGEDLPPSLSRDYSAVADSVPLARNALVAMARAAGADQAQLEAVRLAASEALTNAVIHASREEMIGGVLYLAGTERETADEVYSARPCKMCTRVIINAGIEKVVVREGPSQIETYTVADWIEHEEFLSTSTRPSGS